MASVDWAAENELVPVVANVIHLCPAQEAATEGMEQKS